MRSWVGSIFQTASSWRSVVPLRWLAMQTQVLRGLMLR